jgi:hypothetical protein
VKLEMSHYEVTGLCRGFWFGWDGEDEYVASHGVQTLRAPGEEGSRLGSGCLRIRAGTSKKGRSNGSDRGLLIPQAVAADLWKTLFEGSRPTTGAKKSLSGRGRDSLASD